MTAVGAAVSLGAAAIGAIFSAAVLGSFFDRRKPYNLMWGVGLLMFTVAASLQVVAELGGWTDRLFRTWYVLGAGGLVGFLGLGSVYIVHRRMGHGFAVYILALFLVFLGACATAATAPSAISSFNAGVFVSGDGWARGSLPRVLSPLINVPAGLALIGLALVGLVRYRLKYNAYIAAGAIVQALGTGLSRWRESFLASGIDTASLIYGAEFLGIVLMFIGFRQAIEWAKERAKETPLPPTPSETEESVPIAVTAPK